MLTTLIVLAAAAQAYLLGSVDTGILISHYLYHDDVRNHGSGAAMPSASALWAMRPSSSSRRRPATTSTS